MKKIAIIIILGLISANSFAGIFKKDNEEVIKNKIEIEAIIKKIKQEQEEVIKNKKEFKADKRYGLHGELTGDKYRLMKSEEKLNESKNQLKQKKIDLKIAKKNNK